jgi:integrase
MAWIKQRISDDGDKRFVACYRDPEGRQRSAGTYSSRRAAERAANREEAKVREGSWHDHSRGQVTFAEYVETVWLPSKHVETSTLAAYRSYLDKHFVPTYGKRPMGKILPTEIQRWVTTATTSGLSAASVRKYHTMLHSVFERALRDRVVTFNPCAHTELPKVVKKKVRTLTPEEYVAILISLPAQHRLMVETAINTGLRWGELIALKPRHLDLIKRQLSVEETVVEVSIKNSPTGSRMLTKPYPKDNEPRTMGLPEDLVTQLADSITTRHLGPDDLLFATREGTPISRNTFRTRVWRPAIKASGVDFDVRVHDLRHAHASWLLAGGSDLKSVMDRMGHAQITTTQKYLHTLPDADAKNLDALTKTRGQNGATTATGTPTAVGPRTLIATPTTRNASANAATS